MLLSQNKKKIATMIVGSLGKPKGDYVQKMGEEPKGGYAVDEKEKEPDASEALESAMGDFLRAVESKNAKGMAEALKTAVELCDDDGAGDEGGDE